MNEYGGQNQTDTKQEANIEKQREPTRVLVCVCVYVRGM